MNYYTDIHIIVDQTAFRCLSYEIKSSLDQTTSGGYVLMPRSIRIEDKTKNVSAIDTASLFKRLDPIQIIASYNTTYWQVFSGYISEVKSAKAGTELIVKDEAISFELFKFKADYSNPTVSQIIRDMQAQAGKDKWLLKSVIYHADFQIGKRRFDNCRADAVFDHLRSELGLDSYVIDGVLHIGRLSDSTQQGVTDIDFARHIVDESGLIWTDTQVDKKIKAVSYEKGVKHSYEAGAEGGYQINLNVYGVSQAALKQMVDNMLKNRNLTGYTGSFEMMGYPLLRINQIANLKDSTLPKRDGRYLVTTVIYTGSRAKGLKQKVDLQGRI